ncbi:BMA-OOC-3 [Dirofilaria immitis]|nr:BMA-OOC-3 [Dirofilaria immitis]
MDILQMSMLLNNKRPLISSLNMFLQEFHNFSVLQFQDLLTRSCAIFTGFIIIIVSSVIPECSKLPPFIIITYWKLLKLYRIDGCSSNSTIGMLLLIVYLDLLLGFNGENIDLDLHVDQGSWVDPNDPLRRHHFAPKTLYCFAHFLIKFDVELALLFCEEKYSNLTCPYLLPKIEIPAEDYTETPYVHDLTLKHIIRNFLHRMNVDIDKTKRVDRTVEVYLDADSLVILRKYLNSKDETVTVREQVREIMEKLIVPECSSQTKTENISLYFSLYSRYTPELRGSIICRAHIGCDCDFLPLLNTLLLIPAIVANIAVRMSRAEKSLAEKCKTDNTLSTVLNMVSGLFVLKQENECEQHYRDLYVDPIYEISPLDVICEVLSSFVFTSLGVFGRHFNIFLMNFSRISFWLGGYRIRTFMATVEPSDTIHSMSRLQQTADYRSNGGRPEIRSSGSGILLSPVRVGSNNTRRRSLSTSRLRMFKISDIGEMNY